MSELELQDLDKYAGHPITGCQSKQTVEVFNFKGPFVEGGSIITLTGLICFDKNTGSSMSHILTTHSKPQPILTINADEKCQAFTLGDSDRSTGRSTE